MYFNWYDYCYVHTLSDSNGTGTIQEVSSEHTIMLFFINSKSSLAYMYMLQHIHTHICKAVTPGQGQLSMWYVVSVLVSGIHKTRSTIAWLPSLISSWLCIQLNSVSNFESANAWADNGIHGILEIMSTLPPWLVDGWSHSAYQDCIFLMCLRWNHNRYEI